MRKKESLIGTILPSAALEVLLNHALKDKNTSKLKGKIRSLKSMYKFVLNIGTLMKT